MYCLNPAHLSKKYLQFKFCQTTTCVNKVSYKAVNKSKVYYHSMLLIQLQTLDYRMGVVSHSWCSSDQD